MKKYQKITRDDYRKWLRDGGKTREIRQTGNAQKEDPFRLVFHLTPDTGWLNDPNGLCQKDGIYHIYYQYDPFDCAGELKLWGHYTTENFVEYHACEPVLFPDSEADRHGVYSGSAFIEDGQIHFFYTGNVKYFDRSDYDYVTKGRGSNTIHVSGSDGFHFSEKEVLMTTEDYPDDMSCHVRDPKILKRGGAYYMVLGARDLDGRGLVLLYRSSDLKRWEYYNRIVPDVPFGYMWECPDLFELDGHLLLLCCPQGVKPADVDYQNVHQCVVMELDYDFEKNEYRLQPVKDVRQMDRGCDFYAPQTFCDESGRRILIGWMGIPDAAYTNPTVENGWQHALTLPRQLHFRDGRLIQEPLKELEALRLSKDEFLFPASFPSGTDANPIDAACAPPDRALGSIEPVSDSSLCYEAKLRFEQCGWMNLTLRRGVKLFYQKERSGSSREPAHETGLLTLELGEAGSGRPARSVRIDGLRELRIYSDTSSLEIFVNGGEEVFTTRVYEAEPGWKIEGNCSGTGNYYRLGAVKIEKNEMAGDCEGGGIS